MIGLFQLDKRIISEKVLRMAKKHHVHFEAHKPVKEPVHVSFKTKDGKRVSFDAHETVKEEVTVDFMARNG